MSENFSTQEEDNEEKMRSYYQLVRESKPMWLTNQFVERPVTILSVSFVILFALAIFAFVEGHLDIDR